MTYEKCRDLVEQGDEHFCIHRHELALLGEYLVEHTREDVCRKCVHLENEEYVL